MGWDDRFEAALRAHGDGGLRPARVAVAHNAFYQLGTADGEVMGELAGRLRHHAPGADARPVVGDWVAVRPGANGSATIEAVLRAATASPARRPASPPAVSSSPPTSTPVLVVSGLDHDFNLRRIERYLVAIRNSGAAPVLVLNKADVCPDPETRCAAAAASRPKPPCTSSRRCAPAGPSPCGGICPRGGPAP